MLRIKIPEPPNPGCTGSITSYGNPPHCRCSRCRAANAAYQRRKKARGSKPIEQHEPVPGCTGDVRSYRTLKCRCPSCRAANAAEHRAWVERRMARLRVQNVDLASLTVADKLDRIKELNAEKRERGLTTDDADLRVRRWDLIRQCWPSVFRPAEDVWSDDAYYKLIAGLVDNALDEDRGGRRAGPVVRARPADADRVGDVLNEMFPHMVDVDFHDIVRGQRAA